MAVFGSNCLVNAKIHQYTYL
uniref:Uncharacterized protein n=1 Tax=Arundo donax TaxID=35708 RepID=A0A0A9AFF3_ARUDO